jgi:hypothetical protein
MVRAILLLTVHRHTTLFVGTNPRRYGIRAMSESIDVIHNSTGPTLAAKVLMM